MSTFPKSVPRFRLAQVDDLDEVVRIVCAVHRVHHHAYGFEFSNQGIADTCYQVVCHGVCLIGKGAVCGATIQPFFWNPDVKIGNVVFWGFLKPSGVHIIEAMVIELGKRGATHLSAASHFPANSTGRFYERMGMQRAETQFIAEIAKMKLSCTTLGH
jgi:hypothetical protein